MLPPPLNPGRPIPGLGLRLLSLCLALLTLGGSIARATPVPTNSVAVGRILLIDPSSMPVAAGQATLTIGALRRTNSVYSGDYRVKVFPYFLKNEQGRLAITVSDASLAGVSHGKVTSITGTATTSGKHGRTRVITVTATPADMNHGRLKLCFITTGGRKMIFEPAYHFAGETRMVSLPPPATHFASQQ